MSAATGPNIVSDNFSISIDAGNRKSTLRSKQSSNILVDPHTWTTGSGGFTGYGANGGAAEQNRVQITDDPWGGTSIVWGTLPDSVSGADGGWNTSSYTVDISKTYRWSVWVRRNTSGTGGTFYFGMNPAPIRNDTGAVQGNPYFTYPAQSSLIYNQWYLVVGHCFPVGYSGGRHIDSGWYTLGNKISDPNYGNVGGSDVRWNPGTTTALHRAYHYYTTNTASGLQFAFPRLDKCDGSEPSIKELLNKGESIIDSMTSSTKAKKVNLTAYNYNNQGTWEFDGTARYIDMTGYTLSGDRTVAFWSYPTEATTDWRSIIDSESGRYIIGTRSGAYQLYTVDNWRGGPSATLNTWQYIAFSTTGTTTKWYKNGVYIGQYVGTIPAIGGSVIIAARYAKETAYLMGRLSKFQIYKRGLTAAEIQQNFNAFRSRFGI